MSAEANNTSKNKKNNDNPVISLQNGAADSSGKQAVPDTSRRFCVLPARVQQEPIVRDDLPPGRMFALINWRKKWANGTTLHYYFIGGESAKQKVVRDAFQQWKNVGLGLNFAETSSREDAELRIAFVAGGGSWSYLGRDNLNIPLHEPTMNFGWDITRDFDTALHEIGHAIGFPHEHQHPDAGFVWNEENVYAELGAHPNNWSRETTYHNILRKLPQRDYAGSPWDPNSIMHYPFEASLIEAPEPFATNGIRPASGLTQHDVAVALQFYPSLSTNDYETLHPYSSDRLSLHAGEQKNYTLDGFRTRTYTFSTFGTSDTVMVLFEEIDGKLRYTTADDDGGEDTNARFQVRLIAGRKYVLRVRLYYTASADETSVMFY